MGPTDKFALWFDIVPSRYKTVFNWTLISGHQCSDATYTIVLMYQNKLPWFGASWHIVDLLISQRDGESVIYHDYFLFEQRHIILLPQDSPEGFSDSCSLQFSIDPLVQIPQSGSTRVTSKSLIYYVIDFNHNLNWITAKEICGKVGGHLPSVTSEDERSFLRNLLMGAVEDSDKDPLLSLHSLCRYYGTMCAMFLGLNNTKVSYKIYLSYLHIFQSLIV